MLDGPSGPEIRRAARWLTQDEYLAHLAALSRLEHVVLLLGSGASVPAGGLTMQGLWESFKVDYAQSADWLLEQNFVASGTPPNVETLADALDVARLEWTRAKRPESSVLVKTINDLKRSIIKAAVLKTDYWTAEETTALDVAGLSAQRLILQKLCGGRQPGQTAPWVFTTNYDLAIEWAAEALGLKIINGFGGLHFREFAPHNFDLGYRNTLARGEARFGTYNIYLGKLHGSLTWRTRGDSLTESASRAAWPDLKKFLDGDDTAPGHELIFPSMAKYVQTSGFAYGELLRRFTDILARPQTALITCGYSFSDAHINRLILSAIQNPTLQLVAYLPPANKGSEGALDGLKSSAMRRLWDLELPQVTVVGGGSHAFVAALAEHLPDPVLFDERLRAIAQAIRDDKGGTS